MEQQVEADRTLMWKSVTRKARKRAGHIDTHEERRKLCAKAIAANASSPTTSERRHNDEASLADFPDKNYGSAEPYDLRTLATTHHRLTFSNLYVDYIHKQSFFLCRVIVTPYLHNSALHTVVEDLNGSPIRLQLRYFVSPSLPDSADAGWAIGPDDKLIVLDPICLRSEYDYQPCITCTNPSHVVLLNDDDNFLNDFLWMTGPRAPEFVADARVATDDAVSSLHQAGNDHFLEGRLCAAATAYKQALRLCAEDNVGLRVILLSNTSQVLLQLGHYRLALRETMRALSLQPNHVKTIYRQVRARIALGMFAEALADIDYGLRISPGSADFHSLKEQLSSRATPSSATCYDFRKLAADAHNSSRRMFMCPDYVGPVQVLRSEDKGRGLFAAENIAAGSLVLAEKALAIVFDSEVGRLGEDGGNVVKDRNSLHHSSFARLMVEDELKWRMLQIATSNTSICEFVQELSAGEVFEEYEHTHPQKQGIDALRMHYVVKCNSLGEAYASGKRFSSRVASTKENANADEKLADSLSSYSICSSMGKGVWRGASVLNHDCNPNCLFFILGDFIFVSTFRDVCQGEELTIAYFDQTERYLVRQSLSKGFSFVCCCQMCCREIEVVDELDCVLSEKQDVDSTNVDDRKADVTAVIASRLERVEKVRALMSRPSYLLYHTLQQLSRAYEQAGNKRQAAESLADAIVSLYVEGDDSGEHVLTLSILPFHAFITAQHFILCKDVEHAQYWLDIAKKLALRRFWGNEVMVELIYDRHYTSHLEKCLDALQKLQQSLEATAPTPADK